MMKDLKYISAYIVPGLVFLSLYLRGPWIFLSVVVLFGLVPVLEHFFSGTDENFSSEVEKVKAKSKVFDYLLYANVPIQYAILFYFLHIISTVALEPYEIAGAILSMGISCGTLGINVAHELGHRANKMEQRLAQTLLLTSLYMHFFIEHNRGHHKHVATPLDPATSRRGENLYAFWLRSIRDGYLSAWKLENSRLEKSGKSRWSWANQMVQFHVIQIAFLAAIGYFFSPVTMLAFIGAALVGIIELETVNYLEHYGLMRKELSEGKYERVQPHHSWNTDRTLGRILLYELTRHSDHHYLASRKYQILRHFDESPQLPEGYPAMMVLALFPPLWFRVMDRELGKVKD